MLLEDYRSLEATDSVQWDISDCLYTIRAMKYVDEYIELISDKRYGSNRKMLILLLGERKVEKAIPVLIRLLDDEDVRLHAISALGYFKREEFRPYFERYSGERKAGYGKYARQAIKKLDNLKLKQK
ncbi:MAG: HEAT repeat domain-containing protein, partial [Clostridia bacterium]|nr:HEAT repeat domain-containing protein [Clostridia bacterium]